MTKPTEQPKDKSFKLVIPERIVRRMNREQYKRSMSWLRYCTRAVEGAIDYEKLNRKILFGVEYWLTNP